MHCFNTNSHSTGHSNCCSLFLMMRDMKSARIGELTIKNMMRCFPDLHRTRWCQDTTKSLHLHWLGSKEISKSLFHTQFSMLPLINHCITREPMDLIIICFNQIVYIDRPMKNICLGLCTPWPSMDRCASFWGWEGGCGEEPGRSVPGKVQ